jgi:hypothetical protein
MVHLGDLDRQKDLNEPLTDKNIEVSMVMIHGTNEKQEVKIVDKSKRAYDISLESTKALEEVLQKDKKRFKHICARTQSVFYSVFIMLLKYHGSPPVQKLSLLFILYSMVLSFELVLNMIFMLHIMNPMSNVFTFGFPYLFVLPLITLIAPVMGVVATFAGSPGLLKIYSSMNATMALVNYPLTLIALFFFKDQAAYVGILLLMTFNKVFLSFYGSKIRQHFINPAYAKTQEKM